MQSSLQQTSYMDITSKLGIYNGTQEGREITHIPTTSRSTSGIGVHHQSIIHGQLLRARMHLRIASLPAAVSSLHKTVSKEKLKNILIDYACREQERTRNVVEV